MAVKQDSVYLYSDTVCIHDPHDVLGVTSVSICMMWFSLRLLLYLPCRVQ